MKNDIDYIRLCSVFDRERELMVVRFAGTDSEYIKDLMDNLNVVCVYNTKVRGWIIRISFEMIQMLERIHFEIDSDVYEISKEIIKKEKNKKYENIENVSLTLQ